MYKYVEAMLPDNPLENINITYFKDNPNKLIKLNNKEFVIIPVEVYNIIRQSVIAIIRNYYVENPEEIMEEPKAEEPKVEEVVEKPKRPRAKKIVETPVEE